MIMCSFLGNVVSVVQFEDIKLLFANVLIFAVIGFEIDIDFELIVCLGGNDLLLLFGRIVPTDLKVTVVLRGW